MARSQQIKRREGSTILRRPARDISLILATMLFGGLAVFSNLEPYQQERLRDAAVIHLAAMSPDGSLEPYQEERIKRALASEE